MKWIERIADFGELEYVVKQNLAAGPIITNKKRKESFTSEH